MNWTNKAPTEPGWYWLFSSTGELDAAEFMRPPRRSAMRRHLGVGSFGGTAESYSVRGYLFYPILPPRSPYHG